MQRLAVACIGIGLLLSIPSCTDEGGDRDGGISIFKKCRLTIDQTVYQWGDTIRFGHQSKDEGLTILSAQITVDDMSVDEGVVDTRTLSLGTHRLAVRVLMSDSSSCSDSRVVTVMSDVTPRQMKAVKVNTYQHDQGSFTQGLEWYQGRLYESTGQYGNSLIHHYFPSKLDYQQRYELPSSFFGEGITILDDKLYQLTYKENTGFVYDVQSMEKIGEFSYTEEGWGLTNDGEHLYMTDGSSRMRLIDPTSFKEVGERFIYSDKGEVPQVNELEYVNGSIYGNVYGSMAIVRIDPANGRVMEVIDCSALLDQSDIVKGMDVMNGIAYNPATATYFVTGKNWPMMYEVRFEEAN